jgi:hypothetical protein
VGEALGTIAVFVPTEVLHQDLPGDESVALNLATEEYYGLDPVGSAMWRALRDGGSIEAAHERLLDHYEVDGDMLRRDLEVFVDRLVERGLLTVTGR